MEDQAGLDPTVGQKKLGAQLRQRVPVERHVTISLALFPWETAFTEVVSVGCHRWSRGVIRLKHVSRPQGVVESGSPGSIELR